MEVRLQKILAQAGIASRRKAEVLITAGRVCVNGKVATLGDRVDPERVRITLDGNPVEVPRAAAVAGPRSRIYLLMHKPTDVLCSCQDDRGRRTVLDLLPESLAIGTGLHPVGRLDRNSSGALILTNDGDLTYQLTHPRHHIPKTYRVWVEGLPDEATLDQWRAGGMLIEGRPVAPSPVTLCRLERDRAELEIVLREGRNRQIRRIGELLGHPVLKLHRTAIGSIDLRRRGRHGALQRGQYRPLTHQEVSSLHRQIGLISSKHFNPHPQHE